MATRKRKPAKRAPKKRARRNAPRLTLAAARAQLRPLGIVLTKNDGEYRVNFKGATEATASYDDDLASIVGTGRAMAREGHKPRRNAPATVQVKQFGSKRGHLVGRSVLAIEYRHDASSSRKPYRHDFQESGVEMWALADGSLLIRHPRFRLWDDFTVGDDA